MELLYYGFTYLYIHIQIEEFVGNLKIWLSGAINYQETCLDAFENTTGDASASMKKLLNTSREMTSNGLAMASEVSTFLTSFNLTTDFNLTALQLKRRLLSEDQDVRLLLAAELKPDVVVAKDGSSKYKTVNEALGDVPLDGNKTFVIRIKEGVYDEKVQVGASMKNVVFLGDGPTKTKITGKQNLAEGTPSYKTATVAVMGEGFMAKDIGFENTAGAGKGAAVALLVQSDRSIFQNCRIDGHTNSLYAINYRQFFTNCTVSGAVDFITGDALAVFQNCRLLIRPPNPDGEPGDCFVTAQTRSDKREPSGFVLQNCTVAADADYLPVKNKTRSYLGRPKKEFSSAVFMESHIDDVIEAEGWAPFRGSVGKDTCFYAEYKNRGPGSKQGGRVNWPGIQHLDPIKVQEFTAAKFLGGDTWVKPAGVPYSSGLMNI
ncbi:hypothetical protein V2J09_008678 [Rumex salicifolius]